MRPIAPDKLKFHPKNVAEFLDSGWSSPISVQFQITHQCVYSCWYCDKKRGVDRTESRVDERFISRLKSLGVKSIVLTGGEPLLYSRFNEDVTLLRKHFKLGLVTTLCVYREALETEFDWVKVSIDTLDPNEYYKIRGLNNLDAVLRNLERLYRSKTSGTILGTQAVLTETNKDLVSLRDFVKVLGASCDYVQFRPLESDTPFQYSKNDYDVLELLASQHPHLLVSPKFGVNEKPSSCPGRWSQLFIDANHDVMVCCNQSTTRVGSLYDENIVNANRNFRVDFTKCQTPCVMSGTNQYLEGVLNGIHKDFV